MSVKDRKSWARKVMKQLSNKFDLKECHFIVLAGSKYREFLEIPGKPEIPLEGQPIGKQLQSLKRWLGK